MRYLLDTNVCIRYLNGRSEGVREALRQRNPEEIVVCSVVKAELFYGAQRSQNPQRSRKRQEEFMSQFVSLSFDDVAAEKNITLPPKGYTLQKDIFGWTIIY